MKSSLLIALILFTNQLLSHPVHITIVNIEPNAKKAVFEISCKIFTDDLQQAILLHTGFNIGLLQNNPIHNINEVLTKYISDKLKILLNGKEIPSQKIKFIKYNIVEDATWIYLEYPIISKIKSLEIFNDLLNNLYPDMTNLVIINWGNKEQGLTFTKHKTRIQIQ